MDKLILESLIKKYHLEGSTEQARWIIKDKVVNISFTPSDDKSLVGKITCNKFDVSDAEVGVYNTSQLLKLTKILKDDISFNLLQDRNIFTKILLSDKKYELEYYLADINTIGKSPKIKEPSSYEVSFSIDKNFSSTFINAKKSLDEVKKFYIEVKNNELSFELGEKNSYNNRVRFKQNIENYEGTFILPFSSELFTKVLSVNKDVEKGTISISKEGIIKVTFKEQDIESIYHLIRLEE